MPSQALLPFEALATKASKTPPPAKFPQGHVVLTVGRWRADERYKGMDTLITALPRLLPRWPELQLVAVGDGDERGQTWMPHSVLPVPAHRPERGSAPASTRIVQVRQPIDG